MECVTDEAVLGFLRGTLDAEQRNSFERHLDSCAECLELVTLASKTSLAAPVDGHADTHAGSAPVASGLALQPGTLVGRYDILEPLGSGAMGQVYAARDTQLGRRVAIKLVHPALGQREHLQVALLREAQALARIAQPNVLTVYDMGMFGESVFLAAELVDGDTLDVWLATPRRWRQIVEVFLQAARGLEAAHAVGLVHRDFKPSNAMIGRDGRVRVFDFGVARFVDAAAPGRELAGTPMYMSPEQRRGEVADARSDQYALCVALHRALYGEHPVLRGADDPAPHSGRTAAVIGRPPRWLRELIRRGLEPDPDRRFATLTELRVAAQRGLARRRRWITAAAATAALAIAATIGGIAYVRGEQAPREACAPPAFAPWSAARRAEVIGAIRATGLAYAPSVAARVEAALDQFAASWQLQTRDACLAFAVHATDNEVRHDRRTACLDRDRFVFEAITDRFAAADKKLVDRANPLLGALPDVALCARSDAPAWPVAPADRERLARHYRGAARIRSLVDAGQIDTAAKDVEELRRHAASLGVPRAAADADFLAGRIASIRGQLDEAVRLVKQALWAAEATRYDELAVSASCELLNTIGNRQHRPDDARQFVELARAGAERVGTPVARARVAREIGLLEITAGNFEAAQPMLSEALALSDAASPRLAGLRTAVMMDLATLAWRRGQYGVAEARLREARAALVDDLGELHPTHGAILNNLANTLSHLERYDEAAALSDQATAILERALGPDHPDVAISLASASQAHIINGDYATARTMLDRSVAILERIDRSHARLAGVLVSLGNLRRLEGDGARAEALYQRAIAIYRERFNERHPELAEARLALAAIIQRRGDTAAAGALCTEAGAAGSQDRAVQAAIDTCRGRALGRSARAVDILERAVELARGAEDHERLPDAEFALAQALPADAAPRAVELARSARSGYARQRGLRRQELADVDAWLHRHAQ